MPLLYTKEHFLNLLKEKGRDDIILVGEYINANTPTTFKCTKKTCGYEWEIKPTYILNGGTGCPKCLHKARSDSRKLTKEEYEKRLYKIRPNLHIKGEFNGAHAPVVLVCDKGHIWNVPRAQIALNDGGANRGCPYCNGLLLDSERNSVYALRKDLLKYFKYPDEAKNLGLMSEKKIKLICPNCKKETEMMIQNFTCRGFYCKYCAKENISFPNKFLRGFLKQLNLNWDVEISFDWSKNYRYDGYFQKDKNKYLIEMHGLQHYRDSSYFNIEFQQKKDEEKRILAKENGFVEIEIDCRISSFGFIKNNLEKSILQEILDFSKINWEKVYEEVGNNYVKTAADMYNKGQKITEIAFILNLNRHTVTKYLKDASNLGWCNYIKNKN